MKLNEMEFEVHLLDGRIVTVEASPSAQAAHVIEQVKQKLGIDARSLGWALYEVWPLDEALLPPCTRYVGSLPLLIGSMNNAVITSSVGKGTFSNYIATCCLTICGKHECSFHSDSEHQSFNIIDHGDYQSIQ